MGKLLLALALTLGLVAPAWAAVSFDTSIASLNSSGACTNVTPTIGSGSSRALLVLVTMQGSSSGAVTSISGAGVTWPGANDGSAVNGTTARTEIWHGVNPNTGAQTISVATTGTFTECWLVVMSFAGVDQTTPVAAYTSKISGTPTLTITTANGDAIGVQQGHCCNAVGVPTGCTSTNDQSITSNVQYEATHCLASGASTTLTYPNTDTFALNGIAVKQVSAGAATPTRTLLGVGL